MVFDSLAFAIKKKYVWNFFPTLLEFHNRSFFPRRLCCFFLYFFTNKASCCRGRGKISTSAPPLFTHDMRRFRKKLAKWFTDPCKGLIESKSDSFSGKSWVKRSLASFCVCARDRGNNSSDKRQAVGKCEIFPCVNRYAMFVRSKCGKFHGVDSR